jgi:caffeoyl-CoA O-methyltransferase
VRGVKASSSPEAEYLARHSGQDELLARIERETARLPGASMQVSPEQGALLTLLVRATKARTALEVGTFTGYSAISIARGLPEGGTLTCLELNPDYAATAQRNIEEAGLAERVAIEVGPAKESLERMPVFPAYDFVFLDADKPGYPAYYEQIVPRLQPNGLLLIDNTLLHGDVVEPSDERSRLVAGLNDRIAGDERVDSTMVLVSDGLTFVRKR